MTICERDVRAAGWYRLDVGPSELRGSPDLSAVRELQIRTYSGSGPFRMAVDSLRTTERAERGAVMLTFDDNKRSQYDTAFPIAREFGLPGVVSVMPHTVGDSSRIPLAGMHEMKRAGWDVVSHLQHEKSIPEMRPGRQRRAIRDSKRWLVENGFERGARHVVWPYNDFDAGSLEIASRYHHLGFAFGGCPVGRRVTGPLSIGRVHGDEVERSKRMIGLAAEYNDLAVIMYHTIGADDDRIGEEGFREVMARIDRADVDVITATDLWESLPT
jgi:peptidoglycan/xylan/chitin deacetylase (PgdA/CDA1 family)